MISITSSTKLEVHNLNEWVSSMKHGQKLTHVELYNHCTCELLMILRRELQTFSQPLMMFRTTVVHHILDCNIIVKKLHSLKRFVRTTVIHHATKTAKINRTPLLTGDVDPHIIHGFLSSLGPPKSSTQMPSWSLQPFLQGPLVWQTYRETDR